MEERLVPFSDDLPSALALTKEALYAQLGPGAASSGYLPMLEQGVRTGAAQGRLLRSGAAIVGVGIWGYVGPLGLSVQLLYLVPFAQSGAAYRRFLHSVLDRFGPVAFVYGPLAGITVEEGDRTMDELGFRRFSRSEMRFPTGEPTPAVELPPGFRLRTVRPEDEAGLARLHEAAYRGGFDRYLFYSDPDPTRDSQVSIRGIYEGRWGDFLDWGSSALEQNDRLVGATLSVRAPYGVLIADVMTEPEFQGRGLGRAALAASLRALRERNEKVVVLNVTEGNERAVRLYEKLGFVRTIGPSHDWYDARRIPASPGRS